MISRARILALIAGGLLLLRPLAAQQDAAERLLGEARRLDRDGKVDEARTEYELLVQRFPDSSEAELAQLALAESYWRAGDAARAQATGRRAHQRPSRLPQRRRRLGAARPLPGGARRQPPGAVRRPHALSPGAGAVLQRRVSAARRSRRGAGARRRAEPRARRARPRRARVPGGDRGREPLVVAAARALRNGAEPARSRRSRRPAPTCWSACCASPRPTTRCAARS